MATPATAIVTMTKHSQRGFDFMQEKLRRFVNRGFYGRHPRPNQTTPQRCKCSKKGQIPGHAFFEIVPPPIISSFEGLALKRHHPCIDSVLNKTHREPSDRRQHHNRDSQHHDPCDDLAKRTHPKLLKNRRRKKATTRSPIKIRAKKSHRRTLEDDLTF